jgi:ParB family chromosome partitioning protein
VTTLEMLNPADLLTDRNVRTDLHLTPAFVGSVKANGIIVPIVAIRDPEGIRVRAGHRRTAAAIHAGLTEVPVVVIDTDTDDEATRIVEQIVENHHRTGLSDLDTITAVEQLTAFGVSTAAIVRRTRLPKPTVTAAACIAGSDIARAAVADHAELTLEQAAWLAEFDDDPDTAGRLLAAFLRDGPASGRWAVERARQHRDRRAAWRTAVEELTSRGLTVIDTPDHDDPTTAALSILSATEGGEPLTVEEHSGCGGAVVWLRETWHAATAADEDPDRYLAIGDVVFDIRHGCRNWTGHGHHPRNHTQPQPAAPDADERRAERRRVIALNKAGEAAKTIRSEWLTAFTHRKTSPKDAASFLLAGVLDRHPAAVQDAADGLPALTTALGLTDRTSLAEHAATGLSAARVAHLGLCARLWAYEHTCTREVWRYPRQHAAYLRQLAAWGYPLTPAEHVATGDRTPEAAMTLLDQ